MDCWTLLGIERFSDKKIIKIAYAKKLKQTRPDEDPEGFQQLYCAYKTALNWVPEVDHGTSSWMLLEDEVDLGTIKEPSDHDLAQVVIESLQRPIEPKSVNKVDQQLLDEIHTQEKLLSEDWQDFYLKVGEIIKSNNACNNLNEWNFLDTLNSMNDLEFRKAASDQVFEVVAEVNSVSLDNKYLHIKRPVLNYLNQQFFWDKKWQEYQLIHSRKMLNAIYPYLEEADKPIKGISKKREIYYYRRGAAFAIDLLIFFFPIVLYTLLEGLLSEFGFMDWLERINFKGDFLTGVWVLIYFMLVIPIQESSKQQATIGKKLLGLQVVNSQGDRISFLRSYWRSLVTVFCCIGFKLVVFINIILSYWHSEMLQDTLSRSYVVLRPESQY